MPAAANPPPANPVFVEVHRGGRVESQHRGCAVAVNAAGEILYQAGAVDALVYPRSALKLCISIPLVESGAAAHFNLSAAEIALSCGSHNGEDLHTRAVTEWLRRLDLDAADLENGAEAPLGKRAARALIARGERPTRAHQNCSGKHAGLLTLAKFMRWPARGYVEYAHPAQQAWLQTLSELVDADMFAAPWERDGCGVPAICIPLIQLARAFARYAAAANATLRDAKRAAAMQTILAAITERPEMLAGDGRCCTAVARATAGEVLIKVGAEGVYAGVIPRLNCGFALKIDDGAVRACEVAVGALLRKLGALDAAQANKISAHFAPQINNTQGLPTGQIMSKLP